MTTDDPLLSFLNCLIVHSYAADGQVIICITRALDLGDELIGTEVFLSSSEFNS